jgi:hypothetical protein
MAYAPAHEHDQLERALRVCVAQEVAAYETIHTRLSWPESHVVQGLCRSKKAWELRRYIEKAVAAIKAAMRRNETGLYRTIHS